MGALGLRLQLHSVSQHVMPGDRYCFQQPAKRLRVGAKTMNRPHVAGARSQSLYLPTAVAAHGVHRLQCQRQPGQTRRGGSQHITQVMSSQVDAAEADQQNHDKPNRDLDFAAYRTRPLMRRAVLTGN